VELLRILDACRGAGGGECALATLVETKGSAYCAPVRDCSFVAIARPGARSAAAASKRISSSELAVIDRNEATLAHFRPADDDLIVGLGSGCQGELAVLIEPFPESRRALFHAELFSALKSLDGDIGARQLIRHLDRDVVTISFEMSEDIDTADDVLRYSPRV
jgi:xanthine/CO dehydrogenase XdhC/CoxF family maturation factor